jgi:hypothetical protein
MVDLKHRARHTPMTSALSDVCVNDEDDSSHERRQRLGLVIGKGTNKARTRMLSKAAASWKLCLLLVGGVFGLLTIGAVLRRSRQSDRPTHTFPSRLKASVTAPTPMPSPLYGNLQYGLYRFEASRLGPQYQQAVRLFDDYIGGARQTQGFDEVAATFAATQTRRPGAQQFHEECYAAPRDEQRLLNMEEHKKLHSAKGIPRLDFLRQEQDIFYGPPPRQAQVTPVHGSDNNNNNTVMISQDRKWAWRTAAVFSAQYAGAQGAFRRRIHDAIGDFFGGSVSGTFWYPPNAIREWHTNNWDLQVDANSGQAKMPWRMYYVRLKAADRLTGGLDTSRTLVEDPTYFVDKSALHLVEGPGLPPERLEALGAYRLTKEKEANQNAGGLNVWRIPDQDGYVSLFRLQHVEPFRWHCIVADDSVHRYSLGISLDDAGVEAMLKHAGVDV